MRFLDLFSGIGGFRRGLERSGHEAVGHVEFDYFAHKSYMAMYELMPCPFAKGGENGGMLCQKCRAEHCDGKTCKGGEWYRKDIKCITAGEIPDAEIWTFGFPCTDISLSGRRAGLHGARSGLFFEVTRLLEGKNPQDRPQWIILENVKHLLSITGGGAFTAVLCALSNLGYDLAWQVQNSKDFGVPQNRERVYLVGHLGGGCGGKIFPLARTNPTNLKQIKSGRQGNRIYDPTGLSTTLVANAGGMGGKTGLYQIPSFIDLNPKSKLTDLARCLRACQNAGISHHKGEASGVLVQAVLTPDRANKRQNGRHIKQDGEPSFTLTCQDRHGVLIGLPTHIQSNEILLCRIRKLTPRECFRLQAFEDFLFNRCRAVGMSDSQLYKQAGNAVTVNIVYEIGRRLQEMEHQQD